MTTYYWYAPCPHCHGQGRLFVFKNLTENRLYLHCEECEWGWHEPDQVGNPSKKFLTLLCDFEAETATWQDIVAAGWDRYTFHTLNK